MWLFSRHLLLLVAVAVGVSPGSAHWRSPHKTDPCGRIIQSWNWLLKSSSPGYTTWGNAWSGTTSLDASGSSGVSAMCVFLTSPALFSE